MSSPFWDTKPCSPRTRERLEAVYSNLIFRWHYGQLRATEQEIWDIFAEKYEQLKLENPDVVNDVFSSRNLEEEATLSVAATWRKRRDLEGWDDKYSMWRYPH